MLRKRNACDLQGIRQERLVIDTRRGRILSPNTASRAHQKVDASDLWLYPGLINAHDHLEINHYPRTKWREIYTNASQWAADMQPHLQQDPYASLSQLPLQERCLYGGFKNLFSGVTTVAHHNPLHKPLKDKHFPVRVLRNYSWAHSFYVASREDIKNAHRKAQRRVFMVHLAEGTDEAAKGELTKLDELGCLTDRTLLIHGVGIQAEVQQLAIEKSRGLVWCPSTNAYLLGQTAEVQGWYTAGKLALGSDSHLTAAGDLLDELRAAYDTGQLTAEALFHCVTDNAARLLGLDDVGDLVSGMWADILAVKKGGDDDPYLALIRAKREDIAWVMRDGQVLLWQAEPSDDRQLVLDGITFALAQNQWKLWEKCRLWHQ